MWNLFSCQFYIFPSKRTKYFMRERESFFFNQVFAHLPKKFPSCHRSRYRVTPMKCVTHFSTIYVNISFPCKTSCRLCLPKTLIFHLNVYNWTKPKVWHTRQQKIGTVYSSVRYMVLCSCCIFLTPLYFYLLRWLQLYIRNGPFEIDSVS